MTSARISPRHVTDVTKCLAVMGGGDGKVGVQCRRAPRRGRLCCGRHAKLERQVSGAEARSVHAAREAAGTMRRDRRRP